MKALPIEESRRNFISFSLEPEVCDIDARVKPHPIVPLGIVDEMIQ
jgi:hypothetical protein